MPHKLPLYRLTYQTLRPRIHPHKSPLAPSRLLSHTRTLMAPSTREWLVTIPDHPNALSARLAARAAHLSNLKPRIAAGQVVFGGAMLSSQPEEGQTPPMTGSVLLVKADTEQEVWDLIRGDEYVKQGAWDVEKATVVAFKSAVRSAL